MAINLDRVSYAKTQKSAQDHWTSYFQSFTHSKMYPSADAQNGHLTDNPVAVLSRMVARLKHVA